MVDTVYRKYERTLSGRGECIECGSTGWTQYTSELPDGSVETAMMLCACKSVGAAQGEDDAFTVRELPGGAYLVPSFTSEKSYEVHPESGYCTCKRYEFRGDCEKHVALAVGIRDLRSRPMTTTNDEEVLVEQAMAVFAPVRGSEDAVASYELFLEVSRNRFAPDAFVRAAMRRHGKVLRENQKSERRAA